MRRAPKKIMRDLVTALALCHNVTPIRDDNTGQIKEYQASSPDEVALVQIAGSLGIKLLERDHTKMRIQNGLEKEENYEILQIFPFSSETKRMVKYFYYTYIKYIVYTKGIVLRHTQSGRIIFYLKGADVIMKEYLPEI